MRDRNILAFAAERFAIVCSDNTSLVGDLASALWWHPGLRQRGRGSEKGDDGDEGDGRQRRGMDARGHERPLAAGRIERCFSSAMSIISTKADALSDALTAAGYCWRAAFHLSPLSA